MVFVAVEGYTYTSNEDPMRNKLVYSPNGNNLARTLISPYNDTDTFEKSV